MIAHPETAEDHTTRAMFSSMPEEFFQEFQKLRKAWTGMLQAIPDGS